MRMLKRAAIAVVTASSLTALGVGVAQADAKKPEVSLNLNQSQTCTYKALIPVNVALLNLDTAVGSFACQQAGQIG